MRKTFLVFLSFISISIWIVSASAGGPIFWRVNTRAEIERGDVRGVSIADNGALTLAPALIEVFDSKQAYIWSAAADKAPDGSVRLIGRVDDQVRQVLLGQAEAMVYLSMFEGFGLPPLEAMAASTPVIASTAAAIPEVTGDAAVLCDPLDLRGIASALSTVASDDDLRRDLVHKGLERVAHYDPIRTGSCARRALGAAALEEVPA